MVAVVEYVHSCVHDAEASCARVAMRKCRLRGSHLMTAVEKRYIICTVVDVYTWNY
jgi:hypothetical protein